MRCTLWYALYLSQITRDIAVDRDLLLETERAQEDEEVLRQLRQ